MSDNIAAATVTISDGSGRSVTLTGAGVLWDPPLPVRDSNDTAFTATFTATLCYPIVFGRPPRRYGRQMPRRKWRRLMEAFRRIDRQCERRHPWRAPVRARRGRR